MILSDREARAAIRGGVIGVTPCPPDSDKRWASTTLDLTLAAEIRPWNPQSSAGADVIMTYLAADVATWLAEDPR